jgi:hypothetical protein
MRRGVKNRERAVSKQKAAETVQRIVVAPPNFQVARFRITGDSPLVIHRFSKKVKDQMLQKMEAGKTASSKKERSPVNTDQVFEESYYNSKEGWTGFHAAALRCAAIDACRLVNYKMTLAKMSIFVLADGWDEREPQIPLVRIFGEPKKQMDMARVETGQPYITVRAAYYDWYAQPRIRWDADQFTLQDVTNLLTRVGLQVGIGEGRPFSKNSAGMGWGTFGMSPEKEGAQ